MKIKLFEIDEKRNIYKGWLKNDYDTKNFNVIAEFDFDGNCINGATKIKLTLRDVTDFLIILINQD